MVVTFLGCSSNMGFKLVPLQLHYMECSAIGRLQKKTPMAVFNFHWSLRYLLNGIFRQFNNNESLIKKHVFISSFKVKKKKILYYKKQ